jgi:peptidoglycan hydrolase CwlO-like protein
VYLNQKQSKRKDIMNEVETLRQVVSNLNEAVKELQAELKALKQYKQGMDASIDEAVRRMTEKETV